MNPECNEKAVLNELWLKKNMLKAKAERCGHDNSPVGERGCAGNWERAVRPSV